MFWKDFDKDGRGSVQLGQVARGCFIAVAISWSHVVQFTGSNVWSYCVSFSPWDLSYSNIFCNILLVADLNDTWYWEAEFLFGQFVVPTRRFVAKRPCVVLLFFKDFHGLLQVVLEESWQIDDPVWRQTTFWKCNYHWTSIPYMHTYRILDEKSFNLSLRRLLRWHMGNVTCSHWICDLFHCPGLHALGHVLFRSAFSFCSGQAGLTHGRLRFMKGEASPMEQCLSCIWR